MRKIVFAILVLLAVTPLLGQERDMQITAWVSRVDIEGDDDFAEGFATEFDDGSAMGISVNRFMGSMLSVEASAFDLRSDARLVLGDVPAIELGKVNLTPITLGAQLHLPRRPRIDPYIGAGAAYILASDLVSPDLTTGGVGAIELENKVTYYVNAGVGVHIAGGFGLVVDARYMPYETDSKSTVTGIEQTIDLTPRLLSLGLRLRF